MKKKRQQSDASFVNEAERMARAFAEVAHAAPKGLDARKLDEQVKAMMEAVARTQKSERAWRQQVDEKRATRRALRALMKRARAWVQGVYGDDSREFAAVGGTRLSERKRPVRHPKAPGLVAVHKDVA